MPNLSLARDAEAPEGSTLRGERRGFSEGLASFHAFHECLAWMSRMCLSLKAWLLQVILTLTWLQILEYSSFSLYLSHTLSLLHASLSHLVKDKTRWPGTWSSSSLLSRCEAHFLTDREMIWTVQLHFSTRVDNIYIGLRLEKPLIETSQVVTLQTEVLCGIRRADRSRDHFQPRLKIKKKKKTTERNLINFLSKCQ